MKIQNIKAALEDESGYLTGLRLTQEELEKIRSLITSSWLLNIENNTKNVQKVLNNLRVSV